MFGARVEGEGISVKIPLCSTDEIRRVEVTDFDDTKHENPPILWWASQPMSPTAGKGVVKLWSGDGFAHHAPRPSVVPRNLDVSYTDPSGDGRDDVLDVRLLSRARLKAGEYWTSDGPETAEQIDGQLNCRDPAESACPAPHDSGRARHRHKR